MMHVLFLQDAAPSRWSALGPFLREFWPVLLPTALGFVAVYFLLPQVRRSKPVWAGALAIVALVLGAALLLHAERIWVETVLFWGFALLAIVGGGLLVTQSNPVYAALSFALVVLSTCGLFLLQAAPFLMAATIIIYAGAIVVTFLFVIMLAQQAGTSSADLRSREPMLASLAGFVLIASLLVVLLRTYNRPEPAEVGTLAAKLELVALAKTPQDVFAVMGDPNEADLVQPTNELVTRLAMYMGEDDVALNLEPRWRALSAKATPTELDAVKTQAALALARLQDHYRLYGVGGPLPGWEGDVPVARPALPAANVDAMGRTLFTDYLVPVELAAVLLLVATIGAIAIAGRRSEELR